MPRFRNFAVGWTEATPILELMDRVLVVTLVYRRSPILR
jgi:hypothetical protein